MIRVDAVWLALGVSDLRGGIDVLLGQVVRGFSAGAQPHHAYVFANRRADRLKVLVYDGVGMWLCTRRLQAGGLRPARGCGGFHDAHPRAVRLAGGGPAVAAPEHRAAFADHSDLSAAF